MRNTKAADNIPQQQIIQKQETILAHTHCIIREITRLQKQADDLWAEYEALEMTRMHYFPVYEAEYVDLMQDIAEDLLDDKHNRRYTTDGFSFPWFKCWKMFADKTGGHVCVKT